MAVHFFKVILDTNAERIKIPIKFTKRYGFGLADQVLIKPPDGKEWKVNLTKQNGEVIILDKSGFNIDYPSPDETRVEDEKLDQSADDSVQVMDLEELPPQSHNRKRKYYRRKKLTGGQSVRDVRIQKMKEQRLKVKDCERTSSLNKPRTLRARKVAEEFVSPNKFFTVLIKAGHLDERTWHVPKLIDIEEGDKSDRSVKLKHEGESWNVKLASNSSYDRLTTGWDLFVKGLKLQVGDICIFETIE